MPWPPRQQRAIAADLRRKGKSREEISRFFRKHGHVPESHPMRRRRKQR